jgi:hypothetical protein
VLAGKVFSGEHVIFGLGANPELPHRLVAKPVILGQAPI